MTRLSKVLGTQNVADLEYGRFFESSQRALLRDKIARKKEIERDQFATSDKVIKILLAPIEVVGKKILDMFSVEDN